MNEEDRLAALVAELGSNAAYATGATRFEGKVSDEDAAAIAMELGAEFDRGVEHRAQLAAAADLHIYCKSGCVNCCRVMVMVYRPEALVIARWLEQPENGAARRIFLDAYPAWREAAGNLPERLSKSFAQGRGAEYDALHTAHFRKRILCAFNHEGKCLIYSVRPIGCRNAHALDTDELCCADPPQGRRAAAVQFIPLDQFLQSATTVMRAAHNALVPPPRRHRQESVCVAAHALVSAEKTQAGV